MGDDGRLGYGVEADQQRVKRIPHGPVQPHDHAEKQANEHGQQEPRDGSPERVPTVLEEQPTELPEGGAKIRG